MNDDIKWLNEIRIKKTIKALNDNGMEACLVSDKKSLINKIDEILKEGSSVTLGGTMTAFEVGIVDHLKSGRFEYYDRYKENLTDEERKDIYRKAFSCDGYITGSNAITEDGELYNVDGNGNRVAAMIYGPDKVIVIAGDNKIVKDLNEAKSRVERIAAPANGKRLNRKTPCAKVGYCMDCKSPERMCREYAVIKRPIPGRIHVIFLNEELGY